VAKHYDTASGVVRALDGVTVEVEPGSSLAITGPSGCGKSTLLGLVGGLDQPTAGRVVVGGVEISGMPERHRSALRRGQFGLVFQSDNLLPYLTAFENVALRLALGARDGGIDRCLELLAGLGVAECAGKLPDQLSGGQRQRVAVARALVARPAVILADEPTGSVDADNAGTILGALLTAQRSTGATLVVVTHDPDVAGQLERSLSLALGRLVPDRPERGT
jgi:putative ABC transport system ATP-binding protein